MSFKKVDDLLKQLNECRPLTQGELARLKNEFLTEFTYHSNAIEGNTLTLQETSLILNEGITIAEKPLREHLEVIGHQQAYLYIEDLVKKNYDFSGKVIKDIHNLILMDKPEDKGVYRNLPVRIMGAVHAPQQPWEVPLQMGKLLSDYEIMKKELHPIEYISLFHLRFEQIHPFIDGNGRTGRLILNLELMKNGYPTINVKFADRKKYYDCFTSYHKSNNASQMVEMITNYLEETLTQYIQILK